MTYVTNSPIEPSKTGLLPDYSEPIVYLLPKWIHDSFTAKFNLMEIHEYGKLRQVASLTDIAELEILRSFNPFQKASGGENPSLASFVSGHAFKVTPEEQKEISGTVQLMAKDPVLQQQALGRLKKVESGDEAIAYPLEFPVLENNTQEIPYRVVTLHDTLYILVEEGFISHLEGAAEKLAFLTQVLKSAYAIYPIDLVNRTSWYSQYVVALAAK